MLPTIISFPPIIIRQGLVSIRGVPDLLKVVPWTTLTHNDWKGTHNKMFDNLKAASAE
jgi:hypothetical protein